MAKMINVMHIFTTVKKNNNKGFSCALSCIMIVLFTGLGFPCGSTDKEPACNVGDPGLIPGLGRSPGEGKGYPLQSSGLENPMDCTVHGIAKSRTRMSDFHFT